MRLALLTLALVAAAPLARADTTATSTITQIQLNAPGSDRHALFHGAVWLDHDKATHNYRWGGRQCGGGGLDAQQAGLLHTAFAEKYGVTIEYRVHSYKKKDYRCVVAVTVTRS